MNQKLFVGVTIFALFNIFPVAAHAEEGDLISFGFGYYNFMEKNAPAADFRLEYRPNSTIFIKNLKPWAAVEFTTDASLWVGGGLLYDWKFQDRWYLTPSIGAGTYTHGSSDQDLNFPIQFRTQLEISYEFNDSSRLGLGFSHMSNAGLNKDNPGAEVIGLYWHAPLDQIF